ncbi:MAG TPA: hypothetical protein VKB34_09185 [Povalibacter sp.]|nr:hypothetical protein [Povalibacter sp.]
MRAFLIAVGILSWLMALAVLLIFAQAGGALTVIAAGVFAVVAVVALGCERIIRTLEQIRDSRIRTDNARSVSVTTVAPPLATS